MSKKKIFLLLIALFISINLFAYKNPVTKSLKLQAEYGDVLNISVTPLSTQSVAFLAGMPFSIEDILVQYGKTKDGREIASWSMVSNSPFILKIKATPLKSVNPYSQKDEYAYLNYLLKFEYSFGYYETNGGITSNSGSFSFDTEKGISKYIDGATKNSVTRPKTTLDEYIFDFMASDILLKGLSGTVDGSVFFMFTENTSAVIENEIDDLPEGLYTSQITLTLEAKN